MIPQPKKDELFAGYISRCMRSGRIKEEFPDRHKRIRKIKESWYTKKNTDQLIKVVDDYEVKFKSLISAHTNRILALEIESLPIGKLPEKKQNLFKKFYCLMRKDKLEMEDAYNLAFKKVDRLKMGMI